jgi:hypothetical protein
LLNIEYHNLVSFDDLPFSIVTFKFFAAWAEWIGEFIGTDTFMTVVTLLSERHHLTLLPCFAAQGASCRMSTF